MIPNEVKKLIKKTKRKTDELDLELKKLGNKKLEEASKKLGNKKLEEASKKLEREHVILEGSLIQMATDGQSHNKKLKTENDKLKHELKELKKALKLKNKIKQQNNSMHRELCPHCPKSNEIYTNFYNL